MPANVSAKITFLTDEITGLKSRMAKQDNGAQVAKLAMLEDIRLDYTKSVAAAREKAGAA